MSRITPPEYVTFVLKRLESHGHLAFLVGGCVRDIIMGRHPNDWDVCTDALPDEVMSVFTNSRPTGIQHGTVTVIIDGFCVEVTTFRSDGTYLDHRHPENVRFLSDVTGDLERRDFTVNAMAMSLSGGIQDPFDGMSDIEGRTIRCVGDPDRRFREDALRMFRAVRFSAVLGFDIEASTLTSIRKNAPLAEALARERICAELEKILLSDSPEHLSDIICLGLIDGMITHQPSVPDLTQLKTLPKNRRARWSGFCALLLKGALISEPSEFLQTFRADSKTVHDCSIACALVVNKLSSDRLWWKKLLSRNGTDVAACAAAAADAIYGGTHLNLLSSILSSGECFSLKELAVTGRDLLELGFSGVELGNALYTLLDHVLEYPLDNKKAILLRISAELKN